MWLVNTLLLLQGLFHPARKVRDVYWKIYNNLYIGSQVGHALCYFCSWKKNKAVSSDMIYRLRERDFIKLNTSGPISFPLKYFFISVRCFFRSSTGKTGTVRSLPCGICVCGLNRNTFIVIENSLKFYALQDSLVLGYPTVPNDEKNTFARSELMYCL